MIQLDPNRIRTSPGQAARYGDRRRAALDSSPPPPKPRKAHENHIPETESLLTLIRSAVEALRRGVTWDRGTILNLLV